MGNLIDLISSSSFLFSIIRVSTPITFAALAALITRRAGITNLAIEGTMLVSALTGVLVSTTTGSAVIGLLAAIVAGILVSLTIGFFSIKLETDIYLASLAINMMAAGGTVFVLFLVSGDKGVSTSLASKVLPSIELPIIKSIPFLKDVLSGHNLLTYISFLAVVLMYILLYKTAIGLRIRSVGENPASAKSVGVSVARVKVIALVISGILASLGGAYLSMGYVSWFAREMTAGRGFIGISAMYLGNASPFGAFLASLLFGFAESLSMVLQSLKIPVEFVQMMPYLITILGLIVFSIIREKKEEKEKKH